MIVHGRPPRSERSYTERAQLAFKRPFWRIPVLQAKFDAVALRREIEHVVGDLELKPMACSGASTRIVGTAPSNKGTSRRARSSSELRRRIYRGSRPIGAMPIPVLMP